MTIGTLVSELRIPTDYWPVFMRKMLVFTNVFIIIQEQREFSSFYQVYCSRPSHIFMLERHCKSLNRSYFWMIETPCSSLLKVGAGLSVFWVRLRAGMQLWRPDVDTGSAYLNREGNGNAGGALDIRRMIIVGISSCNLNLPSQWRTKSYGAQRETNLEEGVQLLQHIHRKDHEVRKYM